MTCSSRPVYYPAPLHAPPSLPPGAPSSIFTWDTYDGEWRCRVCNKGGSFKFATKEHVASDAHVRRATEWRYYLDPKFHPGNNFYTSSEDEMSPGPLPEDMEVPPPPPSGAPPEHRVRLPPAPSPSATTGATSSSAVPLTAATTTPTAARTSAVTLRLSAATVPATSTEAAPPMTPALALRLRIQGGGTAP